MSAIISELRHSTHRLGYYAKSHQPFMNRKTRHLIQSSSLCRSYFNPCVHTSITCGQCLRDYYVTNKRNFGIGTKFNIELKENVSLEVWDQNFWESSFSLSGVARIKARQKNIYSINSWFKMSFREFRGHYFVLVKEGSDFHHIEDEEKLSACFSDSSILATSRVSQHDISPIVIPMRHCSHDDWSKIAKRLEGTHSRAMVLTGLMEFVSLRNCSCIKVDKSIDSTTHIESPLVQSLLDFILSDENIKDCQRALMNYLHFCFHMKRKDLLEVAYGRARSKIEIFSPFFMNMCCTHLLQNTVHAMDILQFSDILCHWSKRNSKHAMVDCASALLLHGEHEKAFKWVSYILNPKQRGPSQTGINNFLEIVLQEFGYSEDPVVWNSNRAVVENFLALLESANAYPNEHGANCLDKWFSSIGNESWHGAHYDINAVNARTGRCPLSGVKLTQKSLTDEEYDYLARVILYEVLQKRKTLVEKDKVKALHFLSSDKREIRSFMTMLHDQGPFDLVVDGMNLIYSLKTQRVAELSECVVTAAAWLRHVILSREKELGGPLNVLVVFKSHMRRTTKALFSDFSTVWYSSDDTKDDPFFLYAAVISGKRCKLMTLDELKDLHYYMKERYDHVTTSLIYKWQQLHQDLALLRTSRSLIRQKFDVSIQRTRNTWHIPYYTANHSVCQKWLMLKNVGK